MQNYFRDTWAEINLDHIETNIHGLKEHLPNETEIIAVVKANAYGHGDVEVAQAALSAGAAKLAVAFLDEALKLRQAGIKAPILVLGAVRPEDVTVAGENGISVTAYSAEWLESAGKYLGKTSVNIHLKLDTGMGRIGIRDKKELEQAISLIKGQQLFRLEGIFTHFATADEHDTAYFEQQYERFLELLQIVDTDGLIIHCANSAATLRFPTKTFNAVRFGISMYGLAPSEFIKSTLPFPLYEAFSLHSKIVHIKKIKKGEKVSYGATYAAKEEEWIGTVPIGYADGWIRKLTGSEVLVDGRRVPIIGRICMDQLMIKLPEKKPVGTKVTLIGSQGNDMISVDEVAKRLETINYEIPCMINWRVPRIYIRNGGKTNVRNPLLTEK
ncbi:MULTISPECIES: alanine racemase [Aeribacillus]|uniref:alanine racemase n=1 Tax=Aeribacillus TaxID=1055323 RepID=UPI002E233F86|nr:alanine racemase [Aeribacillus composti]